MAPGEPCTGLQDPPSLQRASHQQHGLNLLGLSLLPRMDGRAERPGIVAGHPFYLVSAPCSSLPETTPSTPVPSRSLRIRWRLGHITGLGRSLCSASSDNGGTQVLTLARPGEGRDRGTGYLLTPLRPQREWTRVLTHSLNLYLSL